MPRFNAEMYQSMNATYWGLCLL